MNEAQATSTVVEQASQVERQIVDLAREQEVVLACLDQLGARLVDVLREREPDEVDPPGPVPEVLVPVATRVRACVWAAREASVRINDLLGRLEL